MYLVQINDEEKRRDSLPRDITTRSVMLVYHRHRRDNVLSYSNRRKNSTTFFLFFFSIPLIIPACVMTAREIRTVDLNAIIVIGIIRGKQNITPFLRASCPFSVSYGLSFMRYRCMYGSGVCVCVCACLCVSI